ncbi:hypothetical protein CFII68_02650 [Pseudomonas sp. CFII68]|nr:hypothetical protein CFII68_02650 [Pseudomonas sp. CFII68]
MYPLWWVTVPLWRGSLLPLAAQQISLTHQGARFQGRFAPQREQAPSPQERFGGVPTHQAQTCFFCGEGIYPRWAAQRPQVVNSISLTHQGARFQGRFAPQREQAPSPQERFGGVPTHQAQTCFFCGEGIYPRWAAQRPQVVNSISLTHQGARFQGRFAPQRG